MGDRRTLFLPGQGKRRRNKNSSQSSLEILEQGLLGLARYIGPAPRTRPAQQTIWPSTRIPATVDNGPELAARVGSFVQGPDTSGTITGRSLFTRSAANTGRSRRSLVEPHRCVCWPKVIFYGGRTASGLAAGRTFSTPVAITANTVVRGLLPEHCRALERQLELFRHLRCE